MKIITDGFEALDAMAYAQSECMVLTLKANTITAREQFIPKMNVFQIRLKSIDSNTVEDIKKIYFPNLT